MSNHERSLRKRIKLVTWVFIVGLVLSGVTAIPLRAEVGWLVKITGAADLVQKPGSTQPPDWAIWLLRVRSALEETGTTHPMLFYGTDWLAFGHFVIALAFVGALRDPLHNRWLFTFGMMACAAVIPYALVFGALRGIPIWWRLIDCSFGVCGFFPVWLCRRWIANIEGTTPSVLAWPG
jgi:hypothetical protein